MKLKICYGYISLSLLLLLACVVCGTLQIWHWSIASMGGLGSLGNLVTGLVSLRQIKQEEEPEE